MNIKTINNLDLNIQFILLNEEYNKTSDGPDKRRMKDELDLLQYEIYLLKHEVDDCIVP